MEEPIPFRHEWTISGLSSVCDRIIRHPFIESNISGKINFWFYPNGHNKSCIEYISFWGYNSEHRLYSFLECKISIKNSKKENLFVKEWPIKWPIPDIIKEYIKRDYLLDPANGLTHDDQFTLCFEGWLHNRGVNDLSNLENNAEWTKDYFDFSPFLSTKSLALKWTIENVEKSMTECTIDGETGKILQNKVVPLLSNIENKENDMEKLEELSNTITEQASAIDRATIIVNNIYHEHYFENCNIKDSLVNTKSKSIFGDISFKSDKTDCTELVEKLENVVSSAIEPVLVQNEQMYTELKWSTGDLFVEVLSNQEEMKKELINEINKIKNELNKLKESKKVKHSKMKKIVDKIIAFLNRIKFQLNKVGTKVSIKVEQVRKSKPSPPKSPEPTLAKSNSITAYIEPHISSLIEYVQSVTISQSKSYETKQSHIHKLETVKTFLIAHLSTENCSTINPNAHFEIDSITLENAEHKLADIIDNHRSDWDKKLLTKLLDLIVEGQSESSTVLSDNA